MGALADGVIVGSAIVNAFHQNELGKITTLVQATKSTVLN